MRDVEEVPCHVRRVLQMPEPCCVAVQVVEDIAKVVRVHLIKLMDTALDVDPFSVLMQDAEIELTWFDGLHCLFPRASRFLCFYLDHDTRAAGRHRAAPGRPRTPRAPAGYGREDSEMLELIDGTGVAVQCHAPVSLRRAEAP